MLKGQSSFYKASDMSHVTAAILSYLFFSVGQNVIRPAKSDQYGVTIRTVSVNRTIRQSPRQDVPAFG
jgi:hypothetical protein